MMTDCEAEFLGPAVWDSLGRREPVGIDATVERTCDHRCIAALCLRNVHDTAQFAKSDQGANLPPGARWRHRLRHHQ
jgi:hypothetical protein